MASVFDLLTGIKLQDATYTQLETMTERSYVDKASLSFWKGVFQVSKALEVAKTAPHGLPLPSHSAIASATIADGADASIKPEGTEVWMFQAVNLDNCTMAVSNGTTAIPIDPTELDSGMLYFTRTLFPVFSNASGSEQTPQLAYHVQSL